MLPGGPIPAVEAINWIEEQTIYKIPVLDHDIKQRKNRGTEK